MSTRAGCVRWHGGACVTTERSFDSLPQTIPREEKPPPDPTLTTSSRKSGLVVVRRPANKSTEEKEPLRYPMSRTDGAVPSPPIQELAKKLQSMGAQQAARRLNEVTEERRRMGEQVHVRGHFGAQSRSNVIQPFTFSHAVKTPNGQMVAVVSTATAKAVKSPPMGPVRPAAPSARKQRQARPVDARTQPKLLAAPSPEFRPTTSNAHLDPPRPLRDGGAPARASLLSAPRVQPDTSSNLLLSELCPGSAAVGSGTPRPPRSRSPAARIQPSPHLSTLPLARAHSPGPNMGSMTRVRQASQQSRSIVRHLDSRSRLSQSPILQNSTVGAPPVPTRSHRMRQFAIDTLASANASSPRSVHESRRVESPTRRFGGARAVSVEQCAVGGSQNKRRMVLDTANATEVPDNSYRPRVYSTGGCSSTKPRSSVSSDEWNATAPSQGNSDSIGQRLIRVRL